MANIKLTRFTFWFILAFLIVLLDQLSKWGALHYLTLNEAKAVAPFLNLTLLFNTGAAFSLFSHASTWVQWFFGGLAVVVSGVILVWLFRLPPDRGGSAFGLSLILGGAVGNLLDRMFRGYVVDFLDFHIQHYHWYVFNLADSAITVGAIILAIDIFRHAPNNHDTSAS